MAQPSDYEGIARRAWELVDNSREYVWIRPEDGLIILRPNRLHYLNATAVEMLDMLYGDPQGPDAHRVVAHMAARYGVATDALWGDLSRLLDALQALLRDDIRSDAVRVMPFGAHKRTLPVLSEIALTYRCNNRCTFCYADAPRRGQDAPEMSTAQVKVIIDRICDEAHCPTLSFTGGEPTMRDDLPELIAYGAGKRMRVNLITNGVRLADVAYCQSLADAGLDSAQVSVEGGSAAVHDAITQHPGSWVRATTAVHNLRAAKVHTHTNTTICGGNRNHLQELVGYIAHELHSEYFSMNMVIRTGTALDHAEDDMRYSDIGALIDQVQAWADDESVKFIWYSPVPYCLYNPVQHGLGSKSCACVDGLISVNPAGELLPCSSFEHGIGDLLHKSFDQVWNSRTARYWRNKEFVPPMCADCEMSHICCGACPLYWQQRGGFSELKGLAPGCAAWKEPVWRVKHRLLSGTWGVGLRRAKREA
jgi:radical SAM protein with 4Fe4S-binding SPASM domain